MGLSSALASALSGLTANQAALSITSSNVANAQTAGYVAETPNQIEVSTGGAGASVKIAGVTRELDTFIQGQLRTEIGGGGFADQTSNILGQLQSLYGTPGGTGTLETAFNNFTTALQALSTSSTGLSAQTTALGAAQALARYRLPEFEARRLADTRAPAWVFLTGMKLNLSSTGLRNPDGSWKAVNE